MNNWNNFHSDIFNELVERLGAASIRFFILRNYKELPNHNKSKDVDFVIDPHKISEANNIIKDVFSQRFTHCYLVRYSYVYCWHGMDISNHNAIHIDFIAGYRMRGYEVFSFNELYTQTINYKNFKVLNALYEGLMVFIYKQFGYKKPIFKDEYKQLISETAKTYPEFKAQLYKLLGKNLTNEEILAIDSNDFDKVISLAKRFTLKLKIYTLKKDLFNVFTRSLQFYIFKINRLIISRRRYLKSIAVIAPDGAGKSTFIDELVNEIGFFFLKEKEYSSIYHFRPNIFPNLGAIGEKVGTIKQDNDFSKPHRAKPANFLSSMVRITYYWIDYFLGWFILTTKDIQFDKFSIFDRYSFDFIVDPLRSRIKLPLWIRKAYVYSMPQPQIVFFLNADPNEIYRRKQELETKEIIRQISEYKSLASHDSKIISLYANIPTSVISKEAIEIILNKFTKRLK